MNDYFEKVRQAQQSKACNDLIDYFITYSDDWNKLIEECDDWNGFLGDNRYYPMDMIDEYLYGLTIREVLEKIDASFDIDDNYFYFDWSGSIDSCNEYYYSVDIYSLDEVISNWEHLYTVDDFDDSLIELFKNLSIELYGEVIFKA